MRAYVKWILAIIIFVYVISPIDIALGPVDDFLLVLFLAGAYFKRRERIAKKDADIEVIDVDGKEI
jgi:hypothetical protein